eukprot:350390-Chlamydomonas_euryale.AAC.8
MAGHGHLARCHMGATWVRTPPACPARSSKTVHLGFCSSSSRSITPGTCPYRTAETKPTLA